MHVSSLTDVVFFCVYAQLDDGRKVKKVPLAIPGAVLPHIQPRVPDPVRMPRLVFYLPLAVLSEPLCSHGLCFQVLAQLSLSNHVGVVSERFQDKLESYIERNPHSVLIEDVEVCLTRLLGVLRLAVV